jgi:hypothetical protein
MEQWGRKAVELWDNEALEQLGSRELRTGAVRQWGNEAVKQVGNMVEALGL